MNSDIFKSDDVANSRPVSYQTINQYGGRHSSKNWANLPPLYRALYGVCSEHILLQGSPGYLSESGYHRMRHWETRPACCAAILVYFSLWDWTRFCYVIRFENIPIQLSRRYRIRCGFNFFPRWRADLKVSGSTAEFAERKRYPERKGCEISGSVWTRPWKTRTAAVNVLYY